MTHECLIQFSHILQMPQGACVRLHGLSACQVHLIWQLKLLHPKWSAAQSRPSMCVPDLDQGAAMTGMEGVQRAAAVRTLGPGAAGLQFYLAAELRSGLRWSYTLVTASCDARGLPLQV